MIITRKEAKFKGLPVYFSGKPCAQGHICERRTINGSCVECSRLYKRKIYPNNRDKHLLYMKNWHQKNSKRNKAYRAQYYLDNREYYLIRSKNIYWKNIISTPEYNKLMYQRYTKYFTKHNREYYWTHKDYFINYWATHKAQYNAQGAKRRFQIKRALPKWVDLQNIQFVYELCEKISKETGIKHNVDHIIPLQSSLVCGLHCLENLRIITETENKRKGNKFPP